MSEGKKGDPYDGDVTIKGLYVRRVEQIHDAAAILTQELAAMDHPHFSHKREELIAAVNDAANRLSVWYWVKVRFDLGGGNIDAWKGEIPF